MNRHRILTRALAGVGAVCLGAGALLVPSAAAFAATGTIYTVGGEAEAGYFATESPADASVTAIPPGTLHAGYQLGIDVLDGTGYALSYEEEDGTTTIDTWDPATGATLTAVTPTSTPADFGGIALNSEEYTGLDVSEDGTVRSLFSAEVQTAGGEFPSYENHFWVVTIDPATGETLPETDITGHLDDPYFYPEELASSGGTIFVFGGEDPGAVLEVGDPDPAIRIDGLFDVPAFFDRSIDVYGVDFGDDGLWMHVVAGDDGYLVHWDAFDPAVAPTNVGMINDWASRRNLATDTTAPVPTTPDDPTRPQLPNTGPETAAPLTAAIVLVVFGASTLGWAYTRRGRRA